MTGFDYFVNYLQEEGYRFKDEGSFISFKYQGTTYLSPKNDSSFLQVLMMWNVENYDKMKILEACNTVNSNKFVVKCIMMDNDSVWVSYESEPSVHTTTEDFDTMMQILEHSSQEFMQELNQ